MRCSRVRARLTLAGTHCTFAGDSEKESHPQPSHLPGDASSQRSVALEEMALEQKPGR